MFRKSSSSSAHLLSNGSCTLPENEARLESDMLDASPLSSLVFYAAVAKSTKILAEYTTEGNPDWPTIAATCLENVPPLHIRFSYTTNQRRFICIIEGFLTFCAIMDEGLSKADAFSFLQNVRDAFKSFGKGRGPDSLSVTLGAHFLDDEMVPIMRNLASQFVGISQKEKNRIESEHQAHRDYEVEMEVSSPSAVAPLHEMNDRDFDAKTEEKPPGSKSPLFAFIFKVKNGKKVKDQRKGVTDGHNKGTDNLSIVIEGGPRAVEESNKENGIEAKLLARKRWRHKVKLVIFLDVIACLILLAVWLGVCGGISCAKQ